MIGSTRTSVCCGSLALAGLLYCTPATAQITPKIEPTKNVSVTTTSSGSTIFKDLVHDTLVDFSHLPSRETVTWLGLGGAIASIGHLADHPASISMSSSKTLDVALHPGETIGGARMQMAGAFATYALGKATSNRRIAQVGSDLVRAQILTQTMTAAVKMSVRRGRPDGTQFSFPSGHSSTTFASATVLQRNFGWKVGVPAYAVATYVAASRIQEKRHFLSDVTFGAAIGIAAARTVTIGHGGSRFALSPIAAPGGGGVSFTWVGQR